MAAVIHAIDKLIDGARAGAISLRQEVGQGKDYIASSEGGQTKSFGGLMLFACVVVAVKYTDWDISIVQAMSSMFMFMAFVLTTIKVAAYHSADGISVRSLEMFALTLFTRLCSTLFVMGYLPDDLSGHGVFQLFDIGSLLAVIRLLYVIHHNHRDTYDSENDLHTIGWTILPSFLLALFVHPDLNRSLVFDTIYTAATVLDTFCLLPQVFMMTKTGGKVESLLANFVVLQFLSRVCILIFWLDAYEELADGYYADVRNPAPGGRNIQGYMFLGLATVQLLVAADFMFYYVKAKVAGDKDVVLPVEV